jgi:polysaccharide deacetylase 2 family uncharacterized protein YibQ
MPMPKILKIKPFIDKVKNTKDIKLIIRRIGIGALIACSIIFFIKGISSSRQNTSINFPSSSFPIAQNDVKNTNIPEIQSETYKDESLESIFEFADQYKKFNTNRQRLSTEQIDAIQNNKARVTLVINNLGKQKALLDNLIAKNKASITVSLSPYTTPFDDIVKKLNTDGIETWLYIHTIEKTPLKDNGPFALNPSRNLETNFELLESQIRNKAFIAGITFGNKAIITKIEDLWGNIAQDLYAQGYGIFDQTNTKPSGQLLYSQKIPAPYVQTNIILDTQLPRNELAARLNSIRKQILTDKNLIISTSIATPVALDILMQWVDSLQADGIIFIPLSAQTKI